MDRIVEMVAEQLGLDPVDVILKNMIKAEDMPYNLRMISTDGSDLVCDSGDFPAGLKQALEVSGYYDFRNKQSEMKKQGKNVGIGISSYIEGTGIGPFEGAAVRLEPSGRFIVSSGSSPHGQSHETTLSQICADEFGIHPDQVTVKAGDTGLLPYGIGTFASRSAVTAGSAVQLASQKLHGKLLATAGEMLGVTPAELTMADGKVFVKASPEKGVTLPELAFAVRPGPRSRVPEGMEPGAEATYYFVPPTITFSSGFHIVLVEVDKDTGMVDILRYIVVHDCGKVLNPMIVEGQIQGGIAQGIGMALYEEIIYDNNGQLITGTFMDYLIPTSNEIPTVEMVHQEYLTSTNPLGIKGVGEGGTISPSGAITNAIIDALHPLKVVINEVPVSPARLRQYIEDAEQFIGLEAVPS
jgi:carbon-monoxide dehydrogenase large subunit